MHELSAKKAQPATKAAADDGQVLMLPRVRRLLAGVCRWLVVCLLSYLWPAASALAQQPPNVDRGPTGSFGSIYVLEVPRDPAYPDPCQDPVTEEVRRLFVGHPFGDVSITCGADEVLARYVVLVQGPRCLVTYEGAEIDRRPCVWLPVVGR